MLAPDNEPSLPKDVEDAAWKDAFHVLADDDTLGSRTLWRGRRRSGATRGGRRHHMSRVLGRGTRWPRLVAAITCWERSLLNHL